MPSENRYSFLAVALILGVVLRLTHLTDPLHEFVHVYMATSHGVAASVTGWSSSQMATLDWPAVFAGWTYELWFGCVAAVLFALIGRLSGAFWFTGGVGLGFAGLAWRWGYISIDFDIPRAYIYAQTGLTEAEKAQVWAGVHGAINQRWTVIGLVLLGVTTLIVVLLARRGLDKPARVTVP